MICLLFLAPLWWSFPLILFSFICLLFVLLTSLTAHPQRPTRTNLLLALLYYIGYLFAEYLYVICLFVRIFTISLLNLLWQWQKKSLKDLSVLSSPVSVMKNLRDRGVVCLVCWALRLPDDLHSDHQLQSQTLGVDWWSWMQAAKINFFWAMSGPPRGRWVWWLPSEVDS